MTDARVIWKEKLAFLLAEEAKVADATQKFKLRQDIAEARAKLRELEPAPESTAPTIDIARIDKYAPAELIGREAELALLDDAWGKAVRGESPRPHVLSLVALGGEGKTSLIAAWLAGQANHNWPGCEAAFAWSFYSQGTREQSAASADIFINEALRFFGDPETAASAKGGHEKGRRLAQLVGQRRALLILDGVEPLQYPPSAPTAGELKDQGLSALLKALAAQNVGLCVLSTRYSIADLRGYRATTAPVQELLHLSTDAGIALLRKLGVTTGSHKDFERLVEDVKGHAFTLNLLGSFLQRAFKGDIRQRDRVKFEKADDKIQGGRAFRAMAAYEQWLLEGNNDEGRREVAILRLMGLFDRPADASCMHVLRSESITGLTEPLFGLAEEDWEFSLTGLEQVKLLTVNRDAVGTVLSADAHPLLREYFSKQLREQQPEAWRNAHTRIYQHLCENTHEGEQPSLEDLQPLYQAVIHGCLAGLHQSAFEKVYLARIHHGQQGYDIKRLGAYGSSLAAVTSFFEFPWTTVSTNLDENARAWLLHQSGFNLIALGRLSEATHPIQASLDMCVRRGYWQDASQRAVLLSDLLLHLGDVRGACDSGQSAYDFSTRNLYVNYQNIMTAATTYGNALFNVGYREEAEAYFRAAESHQLRLTPNYPRLYSLRGFRYCGLLLGEVERGVWEKIGGKPLEHQEKVDFVATCQKAIARVNDSIQWLKDPACSLLDNGLANLVVGNSLFYMLIVEDYLGRRISSDASLKNELEKPLPESEAEKFQVIRTNLETSVDFLRVANDLVYLPLGLLARAWLHGVLGAGGAAQADLDEAWEIAERGPMLLHMADIHLYRARLFQAVQPYPWVSPQHDLAEAERLINECGYHRRDGELADAQRAILGIN